MTEALRHSRVKLTWDEDDQERSHITRRKLTRQEIDNADFRAYLASSESEISDEDADPAQQPSQSSRNNIRALLLNGDSNNLAEGWNCGDENIRDIDMQVTFTPGLIEKSNQDVTTLEAYKRKTKEKKKERRKKRKEMEAKEDGTPVDDEFFDNNPETDDNLCTHKRRSKKSLESASSTLREEFATSSTSNNTAKKPKHFDLKSIIKAEKHHGNNKKWKAEANFDTDELQADFVIDVNDDRFSALHDDPKFAIDPSNPYYKKTGSMKALLDERSRRQREPQYNRLDSAPTNMHGKSTGENGLRNLVESIKRKSSLTVRSGHSKRKK